MKNHGWLFVRSVLWLAACLLIIFAVDLTLDLWTGGYKLANIAVFDAVAARNANTLLNRNLNQLLGTVFGTVAIAVPLTANMYSLKFLELFVKDRVNAAVLIYVVFVNMVNTWAGYTIKTDFIPLWQLGLFLGLTVAGYAMLFPYLYYVFRFLHPNTLLARLEAQFLDEVGAAQRVPGRAAAHRLAAAEAVEHIANIAIRSLDRDDRNTAIESTFTLERLLREYWAIKPGLAPAWFEAEQNFFLGFSSKAVEELTASRSWLEMKLLGELRRIIGAAIPKMPELASTVSKTLRKLGQEPAVRQNPALRDMVIEYFNTIVRLGLNRKDPRSVLIIFDQYRIYAESLNSEQPETGSEIAYYFRYYGQVARDLQLPFVVEAVAHDLGALVQVAWQALAPNREQLLTDFLRFDSAAARPLPGVKKAQALLASYFLLAGQPEAAARIRQNFAGLEPQWVRSLAEDLLHVTREKYWEIIERRMNIDYVPDAQRVKLREFFEAVAAE